MPDDAAEDVVGQVLLVKVEGVEADGVVRVFGPQLRAEFVGDIQTPLPVARGVIPAHSPAGEGVGG